MVNTFQLVSLAIMAILVKLKFLRSQVWTHSRLIDSAIEMTERSFTAVVTPPLSMEAKSYSQQQKP